MNCPGPSGGDPKSTASTSKRKRVTIKNVAESAGVSTATVSHVINNTGSVGAETRLRVEAAIQSMKWKPNINARNLARCGYC
jgi:LacI family transcriptional regulator, repressor for deo operon, udp, cdd, tsx, nupC, and nupG